MKGSGGRGVVSVPKTVKGRSLRLIALGVLLCCALALGGCGGGRKGGSLPPAESGSFEGPKGSIADLRRLPQDLLVYARQGNPDKPLMSAAEQARQDARFNSLFFGPWEAVRSSVSASEAFAIFGGQKKRSKARGWAENLLPWTQENWDKLTANAARDAFPSRFDKAITVRPTVLREAPTHKPRFGNPAEAGEGYPFDMSCTPRFRWGCRCLSCIPPPMARGYSWRRGSYPAGSHGGYGCDGRAVPLALRERDVCGHRP